MRRVPLTFLLFLLICASGMLFVASQFVGESFHQHADSFLQEDFGQQDTLHVLLALSREQNFLAAGVQAGHMRGEGHSGENTFVDTTPFMCSQQEIIQLLLKPGALEIWNSGAVSVPVNSYFNPQRYPLTIAHGKPLFTGADLDPRSMSMGQDQITGYYFIKFSMKGQAVLKLTYFSSHNIGSHIVVTLGRVVISSLVLHYALPGKGQFQISPRTFALSGVKCANA